MRFRFSVGSNLRDFTWGNMSSAWIPLIGFLSVFTFWVCWRCWLSLFCNGWKSSSSRGFNFDNSLRRSTSTLLPDFAIHWYWGVDILSNFLIEELWIENLWSFPCKCQKHFKRIMKIGGCFVFSRSFSPYLSKFYYLFMFYFIHLCGLFSANQRRFL